MFEIVGDRDLIHILLKDPRAEREAVETDKTKIQRLAVYEANIGKILGIQTSVVKNIEISILLLHLR